MNTTLNQTVIGLPKPEGVRAWLPAIAVIIGLPLVALMTTKFIIMPPLQHGLTANSAETEMTCTTTPHVAILHLQASVTPGIPSVGVASDSAAIKNNVARHESALKELAEADLSGIKATDLYEPSVLAAKKAQLATDFNRALGVPLVREVCITVLPGH